MTKCDKLMCFTRNDTAYFWGELLCKLDRFIGKHTFFHILKWSIFPNELLILLVYTKWVGSSLNLHV
jgi:hypothetical protein